MSTYEFSADPARIDVAAVHGWLAEHSYWARGRSRDLQERAIAGSRSFGVYDASDGRQVGYARVVTDGATFAWLCDVIVDPDARARGVGVMLVDGVVRELDALGLKRVLLATHDAHGLYARFGFVPLLEPVKWMERPGTPIGPPPGETSAR
jgi:N-acetylglutamate synthase-like GNAT family acetyltransferase